MLYGQSRFSQRVILFLHKKQGKGAPFRCRIQTAVNNILYKGFSVVNQFVKSFSRAVYFRKLFQIQTIVFLHIAERKCYDN